MIAALSILVVAGLIAVHVVVFARGRWDWLCAVAALDVTAGVLALAGMNNPELFEAWMQEDAWAEWATFLSFAVAAALLLRLVVRPPDVAAHPSWLVRVFFLGLALFCVFVAGEEISWGQRLLAFRPPEAFLEQNYQQEMNLHNLLKGKSLGGFSLDTRYLVALIAVAYGVVLPAAARAVRKLWPGWGNWSDVAPSLALAPFFAMVALAELSYPVSYTGEAAELGLGLCFLADAMARRSVAVTLRKPWRTPAAAAAIVAVALALPPALELAYAGDAGRVANAEAELAALQSQIESGAATDKLLRKNVHKRVYTATRAGYLRLSGPDEYHLDPWNNPYWIRYRRRSSRVVLYSFGPNRRRDSDLSANRIAGDDVAVVFEIEPPVPDQVSSL